MEMAQNSKKPRSNFGAGVIFSNPVLLTA